MSQTLSLSGSRSFSFSKGSEKVDSSFGLSSEASDELSIPQIRSNPVISPPSLRFRRKTDRLEAYTLNKLRFSSLGLYGRNDETARLRECLDRLSKGRQDDDVHPQQVRTGKELLFLSGAPGTGKTSLAFTLKSHISASFEKGLFVSGKFDLYLRDQPFAGIASACAQLCEEIMFLKTRQEQHNQSTKSSEGISFQNIRKALVDQIGDELLILYRIIPKLEEIANSDGDCTSKPVSIEGMTSEEAKNRFNFAFRRFIRAISSVYVPFVIFLDDLQWADLSSLELLEHIIADPEAQNLMAVCSYRCNEVDETHMLSKTMRRLVQDHDHDRSKSFNLTQIHIGDLDVVSILEFLKDLLSSEDDDVTLPLAEICYRKTHGNAFFLINFLTMLYEKRLLEFNMGMMRWEWDLAEIEKSTEATQNVVDLLKARIASLPKEITQIMRIGASLGSTFEEETVALLLQSNQLGNGDDSFLRNALEFLQSEGFVEAATSAGSGRSFKWAHDQIQEAVATLVPLEERIAFNRLVGRLLVDRLNKRELNTAIFTVVNLLNEGTSQCDEHRQQLPLAELNLRAAQKAIEVSAFESAAKYASIGIGYLPANRWEAYYNLSLALYSTGCEAEGFLGTVDRMESYCNEILGQRQRPLSDKFRAWTVLLESLVKHGDVQKALEICREVLEECGCRFPRRKVQITAKTIVAAVDIKRKARSIPALEIRMMREEDRFQKEVMTFLFKMMECCYLTENPLLLICTHQIMTGSIKWGVCDSSIPAFSSLGAAVSGMMNDLQGGSNYARQALYMVEKLKSKMAEAKTLFSAYGMVLCWTSAIQSSLRPLFKGYTIGLQVGDIRYGMWCVYQYIILELQAGIPLTAIEADCRVYGAQMQDLNTNHSWVHLLFCWRTCLLFMGRQQEAEEMESSNKMLTDMLQEDKGMVCILQMHQTIILTYLGDYDASAKLALRKGDILSKTRPGKPTIMLDTFLRALSLFVKARGSRKRKYRREALRLLAKIKNWVEQGNPNVIHHEALLEAECAALKGKTYVAAKHYKCAITMAARAGFIQDQALAHSRFGEFLLNDMSDKDEAKYRFQQAVLRYREWGARAAADAVLSRHPDLFPRPETLVSITVAR